MYKNRAMLKGQDIWITEDLTINRSKLAYVARQTVKKNMHTPRGPKMDGSMPKRLRTVDQEGSPINMT